MVNSLGMRRLRAIGSWPSPLPFRSLNSSRQRPFLGQLLTVQTRQLKHEAYPAAMIRLPKPTYDVITSFIALEEFVREFTGYTFVNRHLLLVAIYGNSYPEHPRQRLAILGDGIVKYAACADWYEYGGATCKSILA
jgi:hypothetical protein